MMLYGSGWNCSPFWGTVLDIYKTLSCKSLIQKKKKIPTYLPTSKMMGRSTANIQFFKNGLTLSPTTYVNLLSLPNSSISVVSAISVVSQHLCQQLIM